MELLRIAVFLAITAAAFGTTSTPTETTAVTTVTEPTTTPAVTTPAVEITTGKVTQSTPQSTEPATAGVTTATAVAPSTTTAPTLEAPTMRFSLKNDSSSSQYCFIMSVALKFDLVYNRTGGKPAGDTTVVLNNTASFNATLGDDYNTCAPTGTNQQNISIVWNDDPAARYSAYEVIFLVTKNSDDNGFTLSEVWLNVNLTDATFPDFDPNTPTTFNSSDNSGLSSNYKTTDGYSYKCNHEETISMTGGAKVTVKNFQFQAFTYADGFITAQNCPDDYPTSDIVPIAVGCALAALVIIVLIAYLIGRKRSRQKGYQSV